MTLQMELDKLPFGVKKVVFHNVIKWYLQKMNPVAFKEVLVWGNMVWGFRCQAMTCGEVFGHEFKIDLVSEMLIPV